MLEIIAPKEKIKAHIIIGGSKSISNRLLLLKEILKLKLKIKNLSDSEDTKLLKIALQQIKKRKNKIIDINHAGTNMRFLTAFLSITKGEWILTGSQQIKERPIGELVSALKKLGADIIFLEKVGFPPLKINGKKIDGGVISLSAGISSQFISALLLISPTFNKGLILKLKGEVVSKPYIEMTLELLKKFKIKTKQYNQSICILNSPFKSYSSSIFVESDWSSASYWYSICALSPKSEIELSSFYKNSLQADSILPKIFNNLGVKTTYKKNSIILKQNKQKINQFDYDFSDCPDIAQTIAITCFGLKIIAYLNGLKTLKIKETDRIEALKNELIKFGANIKTTSTSIFIKNHDKIRPNIKIKTYNDHRMAMSFAPLSLIYNKIEIENYEVVTKSYPNFWHDLNSVGFNVNLLT